MLINDSILILMFLFGQKDAKYFDVTDSPNSCELGEVWRAVEASGGYRIDSSELSHLRVGPRQRSPRGALSACLSTFQEKSYLYLKPAVGIVKVGVELGGAIKLDRLGGDLFQIDEDPKGGATVWIRGSSGANCTMSAVRIDRHLKKISESASIDQSSPLCEAALGVVWRNPDLYLLSQSGNLLRIDEQRKQQVVESSVAAVSLSASGRILVMLQDNGVVKVLNTASRQVFATSKPIPCLGAAERDIGWLSVQDEFWVRCHQRELLRSPRWRFRIRDGNLKFRNFRHPARSSFAVPESVKQEYRFEPK